MPSQIGRGGLLLGQHAPAQAGEHRLREGLLAGTSWTTSALAPRGQMGGLQVVLTLNRTTGSVAHCTPRPSRWRSARAREQTGR